MLESKIDLIALRRSQSCTEFMSKEGTFDWIVSYQDIQHHIDTVFNQIQNDLKKKGFENGVSPLNCSREMFNVLDIGCGTSTLALSLIKDFENSHVVCIDNDSDCIEHMKENYGKNLKGKVEWIWYDLIEDTGRIAGSVLDKSEYFDIIIDKGTFDAILVEGSIVNLIKEILRLLKTNGFYIMCSIHSKELLTAFMSTLSNEFESTFYNIQLSENVSGSIIICKKLSFEFFNQLKFIESESLLMDHYYKVLHPLLNESLQKSLHERYQIHSKTERGLLLSDAYPVLFQDVEGIMNDYPFELFQEDLIKFPRQHPDYLSLDEAIAFLQLMQ